MQHESDAQLLRDYATHGSDPAFAEIVARHTDLIYSAALRQTGSPELAREIAQGVFTDLARKAPALAGTLSADASLAGWLFRGTRFAGLKLLRDDQRRQTRERQFMEDLNPAAQATTDSAPDWQRVAPVLDAAMAELDEADHEAVLLRYFQNQDFHAVGLALGISDDAAQKRVSRAVERLREYLAQRGVKAGANGLVVLISANAVLVAPAGLSAAIAAAATTVATTATLITMTALQKTAIATALAAAVGFGIFEADQVAKERAHAQTLAQQSVAFSNQLAAARDAATAAELAHAKEIEKVRQDADELARLRNEVTQLHQQIATWKNSAAATQVIATGVPPKVAPSAPGKYIPKAQLAHVGYATPEAAMETITWTAILGTLDQCIDGMTPEFSSSMMKESGSKETFAQKQKALASALMGFQVVAKKMTGDDKAEIKFVWQLSSADAVEQLTRAETMVQPFVLTINGWKQSDSTRDCESDWDRSGTIQRYVP